MNNCRLLEKICYLSRPASKAKDLVDKNITVIDTFPYNPESKTSPETAKRWAGGYGWEQKKNFNPTPLELQNDPFEVIITDLHHRAEGGRAYKVIDSASRRFDLREDQVLEVMKTCGILPGGKVPGKFVWGVLGSQIRLVLVGGTLHGEMTSAAAELKVLKETKAAGNGITPGTLIAGHVYRKRDGSCVAFVGKVKAPGNDKPLYAFVDMPPETPASWWKKDHNVTGWETKTWDERIEIYNDKQHYSAIRSITLMSTPKFDAEVGTVDVAKYKANAHGEYSYYNGYGEDMAEKHWEITMNNGNCRSYDNSYHGFWRGSYQDQERQRLESQNKRDTAVKEARTKFHDELVWK